MSTLTSETTFGPTLVGVVRRYWLMVAAVAVTFASLGAVTALLSAEAFVATASLVVENPRTASPLHSLAPQGASDAERYANDQAAILVSTPIAGAAMQMLDPDHPETPDSVRGLVARTTIDVDGRSNVIEVSYTSRDPEFSVQAVNAILESYEVLVDDRRSSVYDAAIRELDQSIEQTQSEIARIDDEIDELRRASSSRQELDAQFQDLIDQLAELQRRPAGFSEESAAEIDELISRLAALEAVNTVERSSPELGALFERRSEAIQRESDLLSRRDQLVVDAQLARSGVALSAPAVTAAGDGLSPLFTALTGLLMGIFIGVAAAYWLSQVRSRFEHRLQPQKVLGVPLLADIPRIAAAGERHDLPVLDAPDSPPAHAFRSLAGILQQHIPSLRVTAGSSGNGHKKTSRAAIVALVSSMQQNGKTLVALNTAVAAARNGVRVLVVDGDTIESQVAHIDGQQGAQVLVPVVRRVVIDDQFGVDILGWGPAGHADQDVASNMPFRERVARLAESYDLILMDLPALLENATAADAVRLADTALVIVAHHSLTSGAEDLRYRLDLIGTSSMGYVYTHPDGSMIDRADSPWRDEPLSASA